MGRIIHLNIENFSIVLQSQIQLYYPNRVQTGRDGTYIDLEDVV